MKMVTVSKFEENNKNIMTNVKVFQQERQRHHEYNKNFCFKREIAYIILLTIN